MRDEGRCPAGECHLPGDLQAYVDRVSPMKILKCVPVRWQAVTALSSP